MQGTTKTLMSTGFDIFSLVLCFLAPSSTDLNSLSHTCHELNTKDGLVYSLFTSSNGYILRDVYTKPVDLANLITYIQTAELSEFGDIDRNTMLQLVGNSGTMNTDIIGTFGELLRSRNTEKRRSFAIFDYSFVVAFNRSNRKPEEMLRMFKRNPALKGRSMQSVDLYLFPLLAGNHYTLLVMDIRRQTLTHYDNRTTRLGFTQNRAVSGICESVSYAASAQSDNHLFDDSEGLSDDMFDLRRTSLRHRKYLFGNRRDTAPSIVCVCIAVDMITADCQPSCLGDYAGSMRAILGRQIMKGRATILSPTKVTRESVSSSTSSTSSTSVSSIGQKRMRE